TQTTSSIFTRRHFFQASNRWCSLVRLHICHTRHLRQVPHFIFRRSPQHLGIPEPGRDRSGDRTHSMTNSQQGVNPIFRRKLTLDRIYSAPSLSGVQISQVSWSPDGKLLTYHCFDGINQRIWAYDVASGGKRILYESAQDIGTIQVPWR